MIGMPGRPLAQDYIEGMLDSQQNSGARRGKVWEVRGIHNS